MEIAKQNGVQIPGDVEFIVAEPNELEGKFALMASGEGMETARSPGLTSHPDGHVYFDELFNRFGKIIFRIHPDVLTSDEAIVGVIAHEMHELSQFREVFMSSYRRRMNASDFEFNVSPGHNDSFHEQSWVVADETVWQMRGTAK